MAQKSLTNWNSKKFLMLKTITSKNGVCVYVDVDSGHAATHFSDDDTLFNLVKEIIRGSSLEGDDIKFEYVFDHVIGECDLQAVDEHDEILYARRKHRDRLSKFVKNKPRHQCSSVTIVLKRVEDGYELQSAWIGHLVPSFPKTNTSIDQDIEEKKYWETHALVWGKQAVDEDSITTICPWDKPA